MGLRRGHRGDKVVELHGEDQRTDNNLRCLLHECERHEQSFVAALNMSVCSCAYFAADILRTHISVCYFASVQLTEL